MGYETTLLIGKDGMTGRETEKGDLVLEDGEAYRPYLKDKDGNFIYTGKKETFFMVYAMIDLCKCGYDGEISKINRKNEDESHHWYWYEGNQQRTEDPYGDKPKPVPIRDVITAIEKDAEEDEYRRFQWALALLKAMKDDKEELTVLLVGH